MESTLKILAKIQERLDQVEMTRKHLATVKARVSDEQQALYLTGKIEEAKAELAAIKEGQTASENASGAGPQKIRELEQSIQDARVGEGITRRSDEYDQLGMRSRLAGRSRLGSTGGGRAK